MVFFFVWFCLDLYWYLAYQRVKALISGQITITKFHLRCPFKEKNFFNSLFELNIENRIVLDIFTENIVNWSKFRLYKGSSKSHGCCTNATITVKNRNHVFSIIIYNIVSIFYMFSERPTIYVYEFFKFWIFKNGSSFFGVFIVSKQEIIFDSYNKRA
jgi:hypothetical protein